jgi:hypothetical protein
VTRPFHNDVIGNPIFENSTVVWANRLHYGKLRVVRVTPSMVKVAVQLDPRYRARETNVPPKHLICIDLIEEALQDQTYCMCGSPMDGHCFGSGHAPVSIYDHHRNPPS